MSQQCDPGTWRNTATEPHLYRNSHSYVPAGKYIQLSSTLVHLVILTRIHLILHGLEQFLKFIGALWRGISGNRKQLR